MNVSGRGAGDVIFVAVCILVVVVEVAVVVFTDHAAKTSAASITAILVFIAIVELLFLLLLPSNIIYCCYFTFSFLWDIAINFPTAGDCTTLNLGRCYSRCWRRDCSR